MKDTLKTKVVLSLIAGTWLSACCSVAEELFDFTTRDGLEYKGVSVLQVTAASIKIMHTNGVSIVRLGDVSEELQQRFKYDPEKAAAELKAEAEGLSTEEKEKRAKAKAREQGEKSELLRLQVTQMLDEGVLANVVGRDWKGEESEKVIFVKGVKNIIDKGQIEVFAYREGVYRDDGFSMPLEQWALLRMLPYRIPDFKTRGGIEYERVHVSRATAGSIKITHSDGAATVRLVDLPEELQTRFNYDPEKAAAALKAETEEQAAISSAIAREVQAKAEAREREEKSELLRLKVFQVMDDGVVAAVMRPEGVSSRSTGFGSGGKVHSYYTVTDKLIFVKGVGNVVDDEMIAILAWRSGIYRGSISTLEEWSLHRSLSSEDYF